jgi:hypothetical protein
MINLSELTAKEIKEILTQKQVEFKYVIGDYDFIWIGIQTKSIHNWIGFSNDSSNIIFFETYSITTARTSRGASSKSKVFNLFSKLINN